MGCIPSRQRRISAPLASPLPPTDSLQPPSDSFPSPPTVCLTKADSGSTVCSLSHKTISSQLRKQISSINRLATSVFSNSQLHWQNSWGRNGETALSLCGPGPSSDFYYLNCSDDELAICMQMVYGYPSENIIWVGKPQRPSAGQGSELGIRGTFILKQNVAVFAKLNVQCKKCFRREIATTCKTLFNLATPSCECEEGEVRVTLVKLSPPNAQVWSDETQSPIAVGQTFEANLKEQNAALRIIGCGNCWRFQRLMKGPLCECSFCERCHGSACEICHSLPNNFNTKI